MKRAVPWRGRFGGPARRRTPAAVVWIAACATGCATVVHSGLPPGEVADGWDGRWQHAFFAGALDLGSDPGLARLCPEGWSEVRVFTTLLNVLAALPTFGLVYLPYSTRVVCAAPGAPPGPPPLVWPAGSAYPPPLPPRAP